MLVGSFGGDVSFRWGGRKGRKRGREGGGLSRYFLMMFVFGEDGGRK